MIFKTFNNDIDKISAKWGIFGKSFNDIGTAISGKISDINKNFQATDDLIGSIKNSGDGIWARLYPTKEQIASLQINVPEIIDTKKANEYLNIMNQIDAGIHPVLSSYQEWHDELADGEKWIARYAQSTKGQIRSLEGVNEANQQARASALAHNEALKQQTLGAKAATVAMKALSVVGNMLAMYAITKLITAYSDYKEKLHDIAEEMSAQAEKSSEYVDNLIDLKTQLEEGTKSSDELTSAFKDQLDAMGYTETEIDNLIAKYSGLSGAIDEATRKALENAKTDAYADVASASKALEIDSDGGLFTDILIEDYKTGIEQLDSEIEKILSDVATKTAQQGKAWISKDNSAEGLYAYYNALKDVSRLIQETASETNNNELLDLGNAFDPTVYGEVTEAINKLKDSAELYGEAISRLHNADAQLELSDYLKTNDINSKETFDNYINGIKDSTEYSESYKQVLIDVANKAFPQFSQQAKNAAETLDDFGNETDISNTKSKMIDLINSMSDGFDILDKIYADVVDKGTFDFTNLDSKKFSEQFAGLEDEYISFIETVSATPTDIEACQKAFNDLTTAYINQKGILDNLTEENKQLTISMLKNMGVSNAEEVVTAKLTEKLAFQTESLAVQKQFATEKGHELANATIAEASEFINEATCSEVVKQALSQLALEKIKVNNQQINTSADIDNVIALANAAGASAKVLDELARAKSVLAQVESGSASGMLFLNNGQYDKALELIESIENGTYNFDYQIIDPDKFKVEIPIEYYGGEDTQEVLDKNAKSTGDSIKKYIEAYLELQKCALEAGKIDYNTYCDTVSNFLKSMFEDGKIAAKDYFDYTKQHLEVQKDVMDSVISAVVNRIEKEIKGLKKQQDAIKERYQLEIDKLNEQKKLIEEANAERQRQIDLQKALYELERAQNQRTTLMYSEEKGMHYVANSGAIRDAQNNLEDKEYEIKISEIEKSIEKLEEARDRELEAIDEMIERLEGYKEYWNEISSEYENQQEELLAAQILGQDWEKQILDQRLDTLKKFKDRYIEIQQAIVDAAYEAAKARGEEAERTIIGDSSARKPGDDPKIKGWEVVNEDGGESEGVYNTEEEAKAEAQLLNKRKAKSYGMSLEEFLDSNIPKYYVLKKYHTGLKQGLVDSHTFDDDFKLVQKVGLGQDEVPAILQKNEAVITPDQISNLANGLRNYTLPEYITPLSLDDSFLNTLIFDNNIAKKMNESMSKLANSISNKTTGVNEIKQEFYITLPNVTDNTAAITLMRDLESLATKKLHEF